MFLKNYTSEVPVSETIAKIERVLLKCGVSGITKEYDPDSRVSAMRFHIALETGATVTVRLPANVERALDALWADYVDGDALNPKGDALQYPGGRKKKRRMDFQDQAERTSWKIVQDWVEVQMSMIQMKQAEFAEVFLPYVWDGKQTVYDRVRDNGMRFLLPEKTDEPR